VKKIRYLTETTRNPITAKKMLRETRRRTTMRSGTFPFILLSHLLSMSKTSLSTSPSTKRTGAGQGAGGNWKHNP
jgi:hypothetical protein